MTKKSEPAAQGRRWMLYAVFCAIVSWMGLWGLVQLPITPISQILFFILLFAAVASLVMPPIAYLNARFGKYRDAQTYRLRFVRQSTWLASFVVITGWLQTRRLLNLTIALILMAVLALIETFLITREVPSR